jgi:hypothetical protein
VFLSFFVFSLSVSCMPYLFIYFLSLSLAVRLLYLLQYIIFISYLLIIFLRFVISLNPLILPTLW